MVTQSAIAQTRRTTAAGVIAYLLISFVFSIVSLVLVIVGLALGVGMLVIWIGLPLLLGTFILVRGIGTIERSLARALLGTAITEPRARLRAGGFWRFALATVSDSQVWKNLLYIVLNVPVSIVTFVIAVVSIATSLAFILAPIGYMIATFVLEINGIHTHSTAPAWLAPIEIDITGRFVPQMFARTFVFTAIGVGLWLLMRPMFRAIGAFCGALARGLLSANGGE